MHYTRGNHTCQFTESLFVEIIAGRKCCDIAFPDGFCQLQGFPGAVAGGKHTGDGSGKAVTHGNMRSIHGQPVQQGVRRRAGAPVPEYPS